MADWPGVFDVPAAWRSMEETNPEHHHERCSYRQTNGAILCDCAAYSAAEEAFKIGYRRGRGLEEPIDEEQP